MLNVEIVDDHLPLKKSRTTNRVPVGPALVAPGEILEEEFLVPMEISQSALAGKMDVPRMRISESRYFI